MPSSRSARAASNTPNRPNRMEIARLRYMADQIARNFAMQGEAAAIDAVAEHMRLYWDPRMKAAILADDRAAHSPIAAAAVDRLQGSFDLNGGISRSSPGRGGGSDAVADGGV